MLDYKPVDPFDYDKFINTYKPTSDYNNFYVWFGYPDERGVLRGSIASPIPVDGVIELLAQHVMGNIALFEIRPC